MITAYLKLFLKNRRKKCFFFSSKPDEKNSTIIRIRNLTIIHVPIYISSLPPHRCFIWFNRTVPLELRKSRVNEDV